MLKKEPIAIPLSPPRFSLPKHCFPTLVPSQSLPHACHPHSSLVACDFRCTFHCHSLLYLLCLLYFALSFFCFAKKMFSWLADTFSRAAAAARVRLLLGGKGGAGDGSSVDCNHGRWSVEQQTCICDDGWTNEVDQDILSDEYVYCTSQSTINTPGSPGGDGNSTATYSSAQGSVSTAAVIGIVVVVVAVVAVLAGVAYCWCSRKKRVRRQREGLHDPYQVTPEGAAPAAGALQRWLRFIHPPTRGSPPAAYTAADAMASIVLQNQLVAQRMTELRSGNQLSVPAPVPQHSQDPAQEAWYYVDTRTQLRPTASSPRPQIMAPPGQAVEEEIPLGEPAGQGSAVARYALPPSPSRVPYGDEPAFSTRSTASDVDLPPPPYSPAPQRAHRRIVVERYFCPSARPPSPPSPPSLPPLPLPPPYDQVQAHHFQPGTRGTRPAVKSWPMEDAVFG